MTSSLSPQLSAAAQRNTGPIAEILGPLLAPGHRVLMIAEGTGTHVAAFAHMFPDATFQPTDPDPAARDSIAAFRAQAGCGNFLAPLALDVTSRPWCGDGGPLAGWTPDVITCINMIHISPFAATEALFAGVAEALAPGGVVLTYGPYFQDAVVPAPSNVAFDQSLKARNPAWGIRTVGQVTDVATANGFALEALHEMPANNLTLIWRKG